MTTPDSRTNELMRLLLVLGWSVFSAFALAYYFIHYYSPTASLKIEAVVLQKDTLEHLDTKYAYDEITYSSQGQTPVKVDIKKYQAFLNKLHGDSSLPGDEDARDLSYRNDKNVSFLLLYVRPAGGKERQIFQEIQILQDDYRVNLQEADPLHLKRWAYFHHQGIGAQAAKHFEEVR